MRLRALAAFALALSLAACGVRPQEGPARLDPSVVPTVTERLVAIRVYLVRGDALVARQRLVVAPATPGRRLAALALGPDAADQADGLRSGLPAPASVSVAGDVATVVLPTAPDLLGAAQAVLTLTEEGVARVRFVVGGVTLAVPRPDGPPAREVTRQDYGFSP